MKFRLENRDRWSFYTVPELERAGIRQGFFTGSSHWNVGRGADREAFLELFDLDDVIMMHQEHSDRVHVIENSERPEAGDAIVLLAKRVGGIIKSADCLPVILIDPGVPIAGIIHAGWRGTAKKITATTARLMVSLGAKPERTIALFGPAIGPCCYTVGSEVYEMFRGSGFSEHSFGRSGEGFTLNLKKANRELLEAEGIGAFYDLSLCTYCTGDLFYSYRKGDHDKRQINFVSLKP
jgi:polyphenol oxidase